MNGNNALDNESISRYSRQLIMPEIGPQGQLKLQNSAVLIIGAGGLGCPAIQYLTAGGVGKIGIVDYDQVEISNLHRQVLHTEERALKKISKVSSAAGAMKELNRRVEIEEFCLELSRKNAVEIVGKYDIVLDATDNAASRYLINDACVITDKPLVSGSALRWEGQLTVYNFNDNGKHGPCYRCLYPKPPPPETVTNCSDGGVLGVVPGIIGCIQALEAIKIIIGVTPSYHKRLLMFDGLSCTFRNIKLRDAVSSCVACGEQPTVTAKTLPDYEKFCGASAHDKCLAVHLLKPEQRISALNYRESYLDQSKEHVLLDVRQPVEVEICALPNTVNLPIKQLESCTISSENRGISINHKSLKPLKSAIENIDTTPVPVVVVCHNGNDSQRVVDMFNKLLKSDNQVQFFDIKGGLASWAETVDKSFPKY